MPDNRLSGRSGLKSSRCARFFRDYALESGPLTDEVMGDRHRWLERGILEMGLPTSAFRPRPFTNAGPAPASDREPAGRG